MAGREEFERYLFFESQREQAARDHASNKDDPQALLRWGGALLELAHFRQGPESLNSIEQAVEKFEAALKLQADMHEAMWCLGNAFTAKGLLMPNAEQANQNFSKAAVQFKKALEADPTNAAYLRAMDMIGKAPGIYVEVQAQLQAQEQAREERSAAERSGGGSSARGGSGGSGSQPRGQAASKQGVSDFWYDVGGWVVLAGLVGGYLVAANSAAPPAGPT